MSAFDEADFGWEKNNRDDRRGDPNRKRLRSRSRSGDRSRRNRSRERERSRETDRTRDRDRRGPRGRDDYERSREHHDERSSTNASLSAPTSPVAVGSAFLFEPPKPILPPRVAPGQMIRSFPFDASTAPLRDWWCGLCSNPNPSTRWDCVRCGTLHLDDFTQRSVRPSTELMSDFVSIAMVHSIVSYVATYGSQGESCSGQDSCNLQDAAKRYCGGDYSPDEERYLLLAIVQSSLKQRAECNALLMYDCIVDDAVLGDDRSEQQTVNEGYVVCLRFYTVPQAKQCLLALQSAIPLLGLTPENGTRFATHGRLRIGFSTRKSIPKPPSQSTSSRDASAPILDIHSEKPASEAPAAWEPPKLESDDELRAYLTKLFDQWDSLIPGQRQFYEANIGRVTQAQALTSQSKDVAVAAAPTAVAVADVSSIKKKLEEKRLALQRQREQQEASTTPATSEQSPSLTALKELPAAPAPVAGTMSVLEKLALKRAQLQQKQNDSSDASPAQNAQKQSADSDKTAASAGTVLSLLTMLPMPPNFPTKTDYTKQMKFINPKVVLHLRGIPMDVSSRVLNAKFL
ncbi:Hypothetical protein, putative [Bodo saltans]|uniref:RanBP2-type domain-containing protein n=1 Tax=Bodo saltans TaxID=75058 RepID=A0A0S4JDI4_BODSA|nr:Hypothetical protein, putative [Bodo saltans]|eukprot:CUG89528.1 Hypothetical protein, putative [Bodo saltans]